MSILVSTFGCLTTLVLLEGLIGKPLPPVPPWTCFGTRNDPLMEPLRPRVEPRNELPPLFPWRDPLREPRAFLKELGRIAPTPSPTTTAREQPSNYPFPAPPPHPSHPPTTSHQHSNDPPQKESFLSPPTYPCHPSILFYIHTHPHKKPTKSTTPLRS